jgi:hypothetical protein
MPGGKACVLILDGHVDGEQQLSCRFERTRRAAQGAQSAAAQ